MKRLQHVIRSLKVQKCFVYTGIFIFCSMLVLVSCTKNSEVISKTKIQQTSFAFRTDSYTHLMDSLYGENNYEVAEKAIKVTDNRGNYYVKEVYSNKTVRGYLVKIAYRGKVVFLNHNVHGEVDEINYYKSSQVAPINTDLTNNEMYLKFGFAYQNPRLETGNPFWGSVDRNEDPYDCGDDNSDCTCTAHYTDYYVFWTLVSSTYTGTTVECE